MMPDEDEDFDAEDSDPSGEEYYPRCHACGAELFDDETVRCPSCGCYQSQESNTTPRHPGWIILTAIILVCLSFYWIVKH